MDPNATLTRLRELVAAERRGPLTPDQGRDFAELFDALDEWIVRGGFLPADWTPFGGERPSSALNAHLETKLEAVRKRLQG
jgi:hypothetical protein